MGSWAYNIDVTDASSRQRCQPPTSSTRISHSYVFIYNVYGVGILYEELPVSGQRIPKHLLGHGVDGFRIKRPTESGVSADEEQNFG